MSVSSLFIFKYLLLQKYTLFIIKTNFFCSFFYIIFEGVIKYGFLIEDGKIYDTKVQNYELGKIADGCNILYTMNPTKYKRLYLFECLLNYYDLDRVFEILNYNKSLKKERNFNYLGDKIHYMANMSVINNYPPTFLNGRKFQVYKICQKLKQKLN